MARGQAICLLTLNSGGPAERCRPAFFCTKPQSLCDRGFSERRISLRFICPNPLATAMMRSIPTPLTLSLRHCRLNSSNRSCLRCWNSNSCYRWKFGQSLSCLRMNCCCRLRSLSFPIPNSWCWSLRPTRLWTRSRKRSASNSVGRTERSCSSRPCLGPLCRHSCPHWTFRRFRWLPCCFRSQAGSLRLRR